MEKQNCPLCERAMNENQQYHRCKHDNVVVWKDLSHEGQPADLRKHIPTPYEKIIQTSKDVWRFKPELFVIICSIMALISIITWVWMCTVIIGGL